MKRPLPAVAVALAVFVLAGTVLTFARPRARAVLAPATAIALATHSGVVHRLLLGSGWNHASAQTVDSRSDRVTFSAGARIVAEAQVSRSGVVSHPVNFRALTVPYGNWIAYEPALLAGLGVIFVLMTAVTPWRRLRNLDVAAALSLAVPAIVLQARYVDASVLAGVPGLGYLMLRCAWSGLGPDRDPAPSRPLWRVATAGLAARTRVRILGVVLLALALLFAMVAVSSNSPVDVIYAVMEGATKLTGGVLPYGHMPGDVVHGDTYPLLSYALYTPLALLAPVHTDWDSVDLALGAGVVATLATAAMVARVHVGATARRSLRRREAGLTAAVAWLAFPPLLITVSTGTTDTMLAAIVALAILAWRRPAASAALLSAGAWLKLAPVALLPLALARLRGRRLAVAVAAVALVSAPVLALVLALGGVAGLRAMAHAVGFQFSRGSPQSLWAALGLGWLQPAAQAAVLAFVAGAAVRLRRDQDLSLDRRRAAAIAAAVLIAMQLVADYWALLYVVWAVPLVAMSVLATPPALAPATPRRLALRRLRAEGAPA